MKKIIFITVYMAISSFMLLAQEPPPPPPDNAGSGGGPVGGGAPIGSGVALVITLAAGYGAKKVFDARTKHEV